MSTLKTAWFSFGQNHIHVINGVTFDKDCIVKITSNDPRETMLQTFGTKWGFDYNEEPEMEYFPRGVIEL